MKKFFEHIKGRIIATIIWDILVINIAYFGSIWVRFDFRYTAIPYNMSMQMLPTAPIFTLLAIVIFFIFRLYRDMWSYAGIQEFIRIPIAVFFFSLAHFLISRKMIDEVWLPGGYFLIEYFILVILVSFQRYFYRFTKVIENKIIRMNEHTKWRNTMVIGAGEAGKSIIHEMNVSDRLDNKVLAIIDDNPQKKGSYLEGVKIYGGRDQIIPLAKELKIREIVIAIPSLDTDDRMNILEYCKKTSCKLKILPGMYQIISGEVSVSKLRSVDLEDLLGREPVKVDTDQIGEYIRDKIVMVTGGGGTIGSEICRQVVNFSPKKLIIFDIYENNAYAIQMELERKYPDLNLLVLIGSVRNYERLLTIMEAEKPDIVYHAAAHKHVPLMEVSPNEAIKNNVFGTYNTAKAADKCGVKRFVLISTDKAVNPTSVMGATKRMCEMVIQSFDEKSKTEFVAVRFGNVLGSNGSVIPLFKKQIEEGGPVTVTHPDIVRYFMTIPEAVSLVLQAGSYAEGGEIFILDMGQPIKILDMAKNLISLSGYRPDEDIKIEFTGLRPGEKLYEEVLMDEEGLQTTPNKRIMIGHPIDFDSERFYKYLPDLNKAIYDETDDARDWLSFFVPNFKISINGIPEDYAEYRKKHGGVSNEQGMKMLKEDKNE